MIKYNQGLKNIKTEKMKKSILILVFAISLFSQCTKEQSWGEALDNIPPGMVSNPQVENIPGGAVITYTLPDDTDLLGVKAVYSYDAESEDKFEVFSSAFRDTIEVVGFPNTDPRTINLICLDKSKNESKPLAVQIQPLTPPVDLIRQSLNVEATFGGLYVTWDNISGTEVGISLFAEDSLGNFVHDYTYYTKETDGKYSFRGFDSNPRKFQIQIRDRWDNYSEKLDTIISPLFEEKIMGQDEQGMPVWIRYGYDNGEAKWRGDHPENHTNKTQTFSSVFDGSTGEKNYWHFGRPGNVLGHFTDKSQDMDTAAVPIYFTIDLGNPCNLSRHKIWHRSYAVMSANAPSSYEIWATNQKPKGPEDFDNLMESLSYWTAWPEVNGTDQWKEDWVKIAECNGVPPSGATNITEVTEADRAWADANGFEYEINPEVTSKPFRYVRFVCQKNWSGGVILHIGEIEFWGSYVD